MQLLVLTKTRIASVVALVTAIVVVLNIFDITNWSEAQSLVVGSEASAMLILIMAVTQHFRPNTAEEPVAVASSFYAATATTINVFVVFQWVAWSDEQIAAVLSLVTIALALIGGWATRSVVTAPRTPPTDG